MTNAGSGALAFALLVLGPHLSGWLGSAVGAEALVQWLWWTAQWPILLLGLFLAFATILYLGPDIDHPRWSFLTIGTVFAVVLWLAVSGAFALFTSNFGSYDKTWGSLAIVIIMLTWLWLSSLALWDIKRSLTIVPTAFSPAISVSRMSRRRASPIALKTSNVVDERATSPSYSDIGTCQ